MPDVFSKAKRSEVMSKIRGKGNQSTEMALIRLFREHRIAGWRRHLPLAGRPDFVFRSRKLVIFVDGCFWHGCSRCYVAPKTRSKFWQLKIEGNMARDKRVSGVLKKAGFRVLRVKECDLTQNPGRVVDKIRLLLKAVSN